MKKRITQQFSTLHIHTSYGSKYNDKHQSIERSIRQGCPIVGPPYDDQDDGEDESDDNDDDDGR